MTDPIQNTIDTAKIFLRDAIDAPSTIAAVRRLIEAVKLLVQAVELMNKKVNNDAH